MCDYALPYWRGLNPILLELHAEFNYFVKPNTLSKCTQTVINLFKRFTKIIEDYKYYTDRFNELGIIYFEYRRYRADMIQLYKGLFDRESVHPVRIFNLNESVSKKSCKFI